MAMDFDYAINKVFDKYVGRDKVPRWMRLAIPLCFITSPVWLMFFLICIGDIEEETEKMVERAKRLEKKEKAQRRKEAENRLYINR